MKTINENPLADAKIQSLVTELQSLTSFDLSFAMMNHQRGYCFPSDMIHVREVKSVFHLLKRGCDDEELIKKIISALAEFTMITYDGLCSLFHQIKFCEVNQIEGDFVETGCWHGGGIGFMALANRYLASKPRVLHAFDSFQGIPEPGVNDPIEWIENNLGLKADHCKGRLRPVNKIDAPRSSLERLLLKDIGYPSEYLKIHEGWFQDTVPIASTEIKKIAILRLDGDLYDSTQVCLEYLYPLVVKGGFVIIDDWSLSGARKAVEDYLEKINFKPYIHHVDATVRYFLKE